MGVRHQGVLLDTRSVVIISSKKGMFCSVIYLHSREVVVQLFFCFVFFFVPLCSISEVVHTSFSSSPLQNILFIRIDLCLIKNQFHHMFFDCVKLLASFCLVVPVLLGFFDFFFKAREVHCFVVHGSKGQKQE